MAPQKSKLTFRTSDALILMLVAYPMGVAFNNLLHNVLRLVWGSPIDILLYGFTCKPNDSWSEWTFHLCFILVKIGLVLLCVEAVKRQGVLRFLIAVPIVDALGAVASLLDLVTEQYLRFYFFSNISFYKFSLLNTGNMYLVPSAYLFFVVWALFMANKLFAHLRSICLLLFSCIVSTIVWSFLVRALVLG